MISDGGVQGCTRCIRVRPAGDIATGCGHAVGGSASNHTVPQAATGCSIPPPAATSGANQGGQLEFQLTHQRFLLDFHVFVVPLLLSYTSVLDSVGGYPVIIVVLLAISALIILYAKLYKLFRHF